VARGVQKVLQDYKNLQVRADGYYREFIVLCSLHGVAATNCSLCAMQLHSLCLRAWRV